MRCLCMICGIDAPARHLWPFETDIDLNAHLQPDAHPALSARRVASKALQRAAGVPAPCARLGNACMLQPVHDKARGAGPAS